MLNALWTVTMDPLLYRDGRSCDHASKPQQQNLLQPVDHLVRPIPDTLQEEREQALRDYKVTIEYKHLKSHAPGGVYLIPSTSDWRLFHGIIFVRQGQFVNGIFKFQLRLPPRYNDVNTWPEIIFSSFVYNPYVHPETGQLDIKSTFPSWDPSRHFLVSLLTFLKKIFYTKRTNDATANPEAKKIMASDPEGYQKKVDSCVRESQKEIYDNLPGCTATVTEEVLGHRVLIDLLKNNVQDPAQVSKAAILSMIDHASKV
jgi:ubiquitin-protein ligase